MRCSESAVNVVVAPKSSQSVRGYQSTNKSRDIVAGSCFQIPSTNIITTEKWIENQVVDGEESFTEKTIKCSESAVNVVVAPKSSQSVRAGYQSTESRDLVAGSCFRVPSTDIITTEKWIENLDVDGESILSNLVDNHQYGRVFVYKYRHPSRSNS